MGAIPITSSAGSQKETLLQAICILFKLKVCFQSYNIICNYFDTSMCIQKTRYRNVDNLE